MNAHEAAVAAMAAALKEQNLPEWMNHRAERIAGELLAALAASPEVRGELARAVMSASGWAEPNHEAGPAIRPWPLADAMLAALAGPEAT